MNCKILYFRSPNCTDQQIRRLERQNQILTTVLLTDDDSQWEAFIDAIIKKKRSKKKEVLTELDPT